MGFKDVIDTCVDIKDLKEKMENDKKNKTVVKAIQELINGKTSFSIDEVIDKTNLDYIDVYEQMEFLQNEMFIKDIHSKNIGKFEINVVLKVKERLFKSL